MADFDSIVRRMLQKHGIRVRRWRTQMSGKAWQVRHASGKVDRWIESPRPRTPISLAIFLHEVGHHVIGFDAYRKRCEEEFHVWMWTLREMNRIGVDPGERVRRRVQLSMQYAVGKAMRRGIKEIPQSLHQYLPIAA